MIRTIYKTLPFVFSACVALAQTAPASFEVATIKPTPPPDMSGGKVMIRFGCGNDPVRVDCSGITLKDMLTRGYKLKNYQVTGPAWIESERYDVKAKIPDGAKPEQLPEMWKSLVTERFGISAHTEKRDLPIYALIVGKGGPKLTPAEENPQNQVFTAPDGSKVNLGGGPTGGFRTTTGGPGGGSGGPAPGAGAMMMRVGQGGTTNMQLKGSTLGGFSDTLGRMLDRPVIDMTNVEGKYDINLEMSMEDLIGMKRTMAGGPMVMMRQAGGAEGHGDGESNPTGSIFSAVQKLGLKLDSRKSPIDMLIVDKAEKPTEN
ncbi:MAG TPA: TIGR03435 family protein [Candidatus Solibacter sp.]|nr:TIGR03435 family protein [Candidatus Solibacter sp.]